jgi:hypothetical protein
VEVAGARLPGGLVGVHVHEGIRVRDRHRRLGRLQRRRHQAPGGLEPVAANRTLAMVRCCIFDESDTKYYGGKWQITHGAAQALRPTSI